jgi:uncharacterized OsmC-like protein
VSERNFNMRLRGTYEGDGNTVAGLEVEHQVDGQWQPLDLGPGSPGFDIFTYAVLTCQHMYFRVNCAERGLLLDGAEGSIVIGADRDWKIKILQVHFTGRLRSGQASPDDISYIISRMKQCPVSRNLSDIPDAETSVILNQTV